MAIRILIRFLIAAALLAPVGRTAIAADVNPLEASVKATYIYKFEAYVKWPPTAFASPSSPFILCIVSDDSFAAAVDKAVSGQQVGGRSFEVRRLAAAAPDAGCHVMFVGASGPQSVAQALDSVRGAPILTVTDATDNSSAPMGIVGFVVQDNKVRFRIDDGAASQNGVAISSELLKLALSVKPRS
jgi:hypothetical protein